VGLQGGQILPLVDFLSLGHSIEFKFFTSIGIHSQEYIQNFIYRNNLYVYQTYRCYI